MITGKKPPAVAIIDMGLGNLQSVKQVCDHVGLDGVITAAPRAVSDADAVILPGVGAFGDAMDALRQRDLAGPLADHVRAGKPLLGICLGMQILMSRGTEFGDHAGFGFLTGSVVRFAQPAPGTHRLKVPQIGWNQVFRSRDLPDDPWDDTPLRGFPDGVFMYFVHSFYVVPGDRSAGIAWTEYGTTRYCSAIRSRNVLGVQFHPERSGPWGVTFYRNLRELIECSM